jgi:hypothetical protein
MSHADDEPTLGYLAHCAQRMREGGATGYCLPGPGTGLANFLWGISLLGSPWQKSILGLNRVTRSAV